MVIVLQVISKCLIRHYSEMSIVSIFLDIRKCSPEDLCVALEEANEIRKEGEPSSGPLRCRSEDVFLCRDECLI